MSANSDQESEPPPEEHEELGPEQQHLAQLTFDTARTLGIDTGKTGKPAALNQNVVNTPEWGAWLKGWMSGYLRLKRNT